MIWFALWFVLWFALGVALGFGIDALFAAFSGGRER